MNEEARKELANKLSQTTDIEMIREIARLGETFLAEQLKAGLAADQRAMTLAAVLAAVIAGLVGGAATVMAAKIEIGVHIISVAVFCICLVVSICMAIKAARPTSFDYAGNNPRRWAPVVGKDENLIRAIAVQASFYAVGIANNNKVIHDNHGYIRLSLFWVLLAVFAGIGVEAIIVLTHIAKNGVAGAL